MKLILNGVNGRMGRQVAEAVQADSDVEIIAGIDRNPELFENTFPVYESPFDIKEKADAIIDFSNPAVIPSLLEYAKANRLPLVIATTGLSQENLEQIQTASNYIPILRAANMSMGINLMRELVQRTSEILGDTFDIEIIEKHHNQKADSPSGTAYALAEAANSALSEQRKYVYGRNSADDKRTKNEIGFHSVRGGTLTGVHTVMYAGRDEMIEITHTALSRQIFANGAIYAAKYILKKAPGIYDMQDALQNESIITDIYTSNDEAMITINHLPNESAILTELFSGFAGQNINIDMISQTAPVNGLINISFTLPAVDLNAATKVINEYNTANTSIQTEIFDAVTKLTIEGMGMERQSGVAAKVFRALGEHDIRIKTITTSESKIACIIDQSDEKDAIGAVIDAFCIR